MFVTDSEQSLTHHLLRSRKEAPSEYVLFTNRIQKKVGDDLIKNSFLKKMPSLDMIVN